MSLSVFRVCGDTSAVEFRFGSPGGRDARGPGDGGESAAHQGGEDGHETDEDHTGFAAAGRRGLEFEEIEDGEAVEGAPARDRVVAGLVAAGPAGAFGDIERDAQASAVELIGEFGALERKPTNDVGPKSQSQAVRIEAMQGSDWRE